VSGNKISISCSVRFDTKSDVKKEMTLNKLINPMREEQSKTDTTIMSIELGYCKRKPKASIVIDE
jgi:hypothetical protein